MRRRSILSLHVSRHVSAAAAMLGLLCAPGAVHADGNDTPFTNVIALVSQRLALAEPVARYKWARHEPVTDEPRENVLLNQVEEKAKSAQINPDFARQFFRDQIDASKDVQNALIANWRVAKAKPDGAPPDFAKETRPKFDRLTQSLIGALARIEPVRHADDCPLRLADSLARWKHLTRYDASMNAPLMHALSHVCALGGVGAVG